MNCSDKNIHFKDNKLSDLDYQSVHGIGNIAERNQKKMPDRSPAWQKITVTQLHKLNAH